MLIIHDPNSNIRRKVMAGPRRCKNHVILGRPFDSLIVWYLHLGPLFPKECNHLACSYIFLTFSSTRPLLLIYVQQVLLMIAQTPPCSARK